MNDKYDAEWLADLNTFLDEIDPEQEPAPAAEDAPLVAPRPLDGLRCAPGRETPKAVQFMIEEQPGIEEEHGVWLPRSAFNLTRVGDVCKITYPDWIAEEKGLPRTLGYDKRIPGEVPRAPRGAPSARKLLADMAGQSLNDLGKVLCEVHVIDVIDKSDDAMQLWTDEEKCPEWFPRSQIILLGDPPHTIAAMPIWLAKKHSLAYALPTRLHAGRQTQD